MGVRGSGRQAGRGPDPPHRPRVAAATALPRLSRPPRPAVAPRPARGCSARPDRTAALADPLPPPRTAARAARGGRARPGGSPRSLPSSALTARPRAALGRRGAVHALRARLREEPRRGRDHQVGVEPTGPADHVGVRVHRVADAPRGVGQVVRQRIRRAEPRQRTRHGAERDCEGRRAAAVDADAHLGRVDAREERDVPADRHLHGVIAGRGRCRAASPRCFAVASIIACLPEQFDQMGRGVSVSACCRCRSSGSKA